MRLRAWLGAAGANVLPEIVQTVVEIAAEVEDRVVADEAVAAAADPGVAVGAEGMAAVTADRGTRKTHEFRKAACTRPFCFYRRFYLPAAPFARRALIPIGGGDDG